jgi:hypothetical protein
MKGRSLAKIAIEYFVMTDLISGCVEDASAHFAGWLYSKEMSSSTRVLSGFTVSKTSLCDRDGSIRPNHVVLEMNTAAN